MMNAMSDTRPNTATEEQEKKLFLLQIANSSFPTGAFNHSYGFETWFSDGRISDGASFETACRDWLIYCLSRSESIAVAKACEMMKLADHEGLIGLDVRLGALKLGRESREASLMTGQALLTAYMDIFDKPGLDGYARAVEAGDAEGHHAVVFGAICGNFDISGTDAVLTFTHAAVSSLVGVACRLIPLGQVETQRILKNTWPLLEETALQAVDSGIDDMNNAAANLDLASMRHETLKTRLCIS